MGSPGPSLITSVMQFFVLLSAVSLAFAAPMPEGEEAPAALPYVHGATGDVAEPYVPDEIAAVPYVHEEIEAAPYEHDATGDVAEVYTHVEPVVAPVAPVTYAAYPYAGVYAGHPITYTGHPLTYAAFPYAVHTGCVNSVGS